MKSAVKYLITTTVIVCAGCVSAGGAAAQTIDYEAIQRSKVYRASRAEGRIVLDGRIDEEAWTRASAGGDFYESEPRTGTLASDKTEFRIVYDEDNIYVAVDAVQSTPVTTNDLSRDFPPSDNDMIALVFDTFDDDRNGFVFQTNPGGAQRDQQIVQQTLNANWDAVWRVSSARREGGWSAEFEIPLKTLRFKEGESARAWGFNILRIIAGRNERDSWSLGPRPNDALKVAVAGRLEGLDDIRQGRNLSVKPFAVSTHRPRLAGSSVLKRHETEAGLDVKYGVTSSLTLDLTFNTDFSQVEADDQQINLTRFSLFFPEKREFFLENAGIFDMGADGDRTTSSTDRPDVIPFFSRRIGLSSTGAPLPAKAGARLTGGLAGFDVGILNMQVDSQGTIPADNWSVVRLQRDLLANSSIGGFLLNRASDALANRNRVGGLDATFRLFDRRLVMSGVAMRSDTAQADAGNVASNGEVSYTDPFFGFRASYATLQEHFRNDFGFVARPAVNEARVSGGIKLRPRSGPIREIGPRFESDYITDSSGALLTHTKSATVDVAFQAGDSINVSRNMNVEQLDATFNLRPTLALAPGRYTFDDWELGFATSKARRLYASGSIKTGDFWDGTGREVRAGLGARQSSHFSVDLSWIRNWAQLGAGELKTDLLRARLRYAYSPRVLVDSLLQYNTDARTMASNVRFRFIHRPLSDLYVVFDESRGILGLASVNRAVSVKFTEWLTF